MNLASLVRESLAVSAFLQKPQKIVKQALAENYSPDTDFDRWAEHMDKKYFDFFDVNADGKIFAEEIHEQFLGINPHETWADSVEMIAVADNNLDGHLDWAEWEGYSVYMRQLTRKDRGPEYGSAEAFVYWFLLNTNRDDFIEV